MMLSRIIEKENNNIHVVVRVDIKRAEFLSSEYDLVKDFYKQMVDFLSEPVVFKIQIIYEALFSFAYYPVTIGC